MKQLQSNFTTPEQSNRLLELGLSAWTADIMFDKNRRRYELIETEDESLAETQRTLFYNGGAIPHWSVGRLIELMLICCSDDMVFWRGNPVMDSLYHDVTCQLQNNLWDFSKLED